MSDRYMIKKAEDATSRLAHALGKEFDVEGCWKKTRDESGNLRAKKGCWYLENIPEYGGVVILEVTSEGGGVKEPFGTRRRKSEEFVASVNMAIDAVHIYKEKKKQQNLKERTELNYPDSPIMGTGIFVAKKKLRK